MADRYVCVFGASSSAVPNEHIEFAYELGARLALLGMGLVFGAGRTGLMGATAGGAHKNGGEIIGVIPEKLNLPGIYFEHCTERIETKTMHERKSAMEEKSSAFIALGGGFGTLEELLEVITLKQLGYHSKPIIIVNIGGFYDALIAQFERCVNDGFANPLFMRLFTVVHTVDEAIEAIDNSDTPVLPDKMQDAIRSAHFGKHD
ncbi:MAG: TIGR00730 family Rossman fold protein [Clostridia bacterium]|nr:TIGR00730 family Rossman fold protein [Clostridia bacterium]